MPDYVNPVKPHHVQALDELIRHATETAAFLKDLGECNLPADELSAQNHQQIMTAIAIKKKFAPQAP